MSKLLVEPKDDTHVTLDNMFTFTQNLLDADTLEIKIDNKNDYSLFTFGIIFAYVHHEDMLKEKSGLEIQFSEEKHLFEKTILPSEKISETPKKSFYNILADLINNKFIPIDVYGVKEDRGYLVSPVKDTDKVAKERLRKVRDEVSEKLSIPKIHLPFDDTDQDNDDRGTRICRDNLIATANAKHQLLYYSPTSTGSTFDMGMWFMLENFIDKHFPILSEEKFQMSKRNFTIVNPQDLDMERPYCQLITKMERAIINPQNNKPYK